MGFSPREVDAMSLWEFGACIRGYSRAQGGEPKPEPPSDEEFDAMLTTVGRA